ncbi:hypothetical protein Thiowin_04288 [Thiorhodovibrio winogradskyi]|uniref:Uncharacterized protein n=1 Tax=Thiorhodovibrio winogradskyi TaxID=77007 RepID=A0ABZ0SGJ9_9GAMM|nr:DUF6447 family protein [Thiorhodovibrio winogradskyi]
MTESTEAKLTIDGKEYRVADLPDAAKTQVQNLRVSELELQRLQAQIGMIQTARNVYLKALKAALPVEPPLKH